MAYVGMGEDTCDAITAKILMLEKAIAEEKNEKEKEALRKDEEALRKKEEALRKEKEDLRKEKEDLRKEKEDLRTKEIMQMQMKLQATSSSGKFYV